MDSPQGSELPSATPCYPEPTSEDHELRRREDIQEFLARSTRSHAIELRQFINGSLAFFPTDVRASLCRALHGPDLRSALFELVVARVLQTLGATGVLYEVPVSTGERPDLRAAFVDSAVLVDATVPEFDAEIAEAQRRNEYLIEIIEDLIPSGWSFFVGRLPQIGPSDSKREFKDALAAAFATLPPSAEGIEPLGHELVVAHSLGEIRLRIGAMRSGWQRAYLGGPASAAWGDADARISKALRRKRAQLRSGEAPKLVAIAGGMGETVEDFDIALFGRTFERHDEHGRAVEFGFDPSGIWGKLRGGESVLAGVLAFCHWQWTVGDDPVLYMNPRFAGDLPQSLRLLQRRELKDGSLAPTPAAASGLFDVMRTSVGLPSGGPFRAR